VQLHFPAPERGSGYTLICDPTNSPLRWLRFGRLWLPDRDSDWQHETGDHEETLALFHGSAVVQVIDGPRYAIGPRRGPFAGPPTMVYLPAGCSYRVTAGPDGLDAGVVGAPAERGGAPILIPPDAARETRHGAGKWGRKIYMGTAADYPIQRLMVGETLNRPGGWTSFPPHKHDTRNPPEMPYEEIYFFLMKPRAGFAVQRIYDPPDREGAIDVAMVVRDGDTIVIPHGYHPVIGAPGYQMYYLWMLCGEVGARTYGQVTIDPDHAWLQQVEPLLED
jgi:5-deoxy-glucuronate isomerase